MTLGDFADWASLLGLLLTIWFIVLARSAAEQASKAAQQVKDRLANLDMLGEMSAAVATLDEVKHLQESGPGILRWTDTA